MCKDLASLVHQDMPVAKTGPEARNLVHYACAPLTRLAALQVLVSTHTCEQTRHLPDLKKQKQKKNLRYLNFFR